MLLAQIDAVSDKLHSVRSCVVALSKCIQLSNTGNIDVESLLEIFRLLKEHGDSILADDVVCELFGITAET